MPMRSARAAEKPDIIVFLADDMGYSDIGCYGGEIATPNLDKLAAAGMRFTQCYSNAKCSPSRATILTGLYRERMDVGDMVTIRDDCLTIGEVLKTAGYHTITSGKWHSRINPVKRGFDRYFGLNDGCCNFWNPGKKRLGEPAPVEKRGLRKWNIEGKEGPYTPDDPKFYTTDAFSSYAAERITEHAARRDGWPFFLYLAYTAPHYPLHAWPEDIARYRGKYKVGYEAVRQARWRRMIGMGLVEERWGISPTVGDWGRADHDDEDLKMAVYAAMVDRMDQGIGKVLEAVRRAGREENTLVMFLSDNGACAERIHKGPAPPGPVDGYHTVDRNWANVSNTPYRKYKSSDWGGGIGGPLVVSWPRAIAKPGSITNEMTHFIDIMPTVCDAAGARHPAETDPRYLGPDGRSLVPVFRGEAREGHGHLCWTYGRCRAVRAGKWKMVGGGKKFELYDMEADRCELNDLAKRHPEKVKELERVWQAWSEDCARSRKGKRSR
jgi:arylsulfatase